MNVQSYQGDVIFYTNAETPGTRFRHDAVTARVEGSYEFDLKVVNPHLTIRFITSADESFQAVVSFDSSTGIQSFYINSKSECFLTSDGEASNFRVQPVMVWVPCESTGPAQESPF